MSFGGSGLGGNANPNNDFQVANPPADGVSSLSWSPTSNFLVATSWDCDVLCYEVQSNGQAMPKASIKHEAPVLCSAWNADGSAVFSGGCDNQVKKWDLATNQPSQVAGHDAPVRHLAWIQEAGFLAGAPCRSRQNGWLFSIFGISEPPPFSCVPGALTRVFVCLSTSSADPVVEPRGPHRPAMKTRVVRAPEEIVNLRKHLWAWDPAGW